MARPSGTIPALTPEQHRQSHIELHDAFDRLLADYLLHHKGKVPSKTTLTELMEWSYQQTQHPDEP